MEGIQPHIINARELSAGDRKALTRKLKRSEVIQVAKGFYTDPHLWHELGKTYQGQLTQQLGRIVLTARSSGNALVVGKSAALIHQLPGKTGRLSQTIELGRFGWGQKNNSPTQKWRQIPAPHRANVELKRTQFGNVWVSGLLDTCRDLSLWHPLEDAVVATEYALNKGLLDWQEWLDSEAGLKCRHGARQARQTYKLITPWSESPRESELKIAMWQAGLPAPYQQATIYDDTGRIIGRPDFLHEEGIASEYDGADKYGETFHEALHAFQKERTREAAIQGHGIHFIRINAINYRDGSAVQHIQTLLNTSRDRARTLGTTPQLPRHRWSSPGKAWRD